MIQIFSLLLNSVLKGQNKKQSIIQSPLLRLKHPIKTIHYIPGRVRFEIPAIKNNQGAAGLVQEQLKNVKGVFTIEASPISGRVLIEYDPSLLEAEILFAALIKVLGLEKEMESIPDSKASKEINFLFRFLNRAIFDQTNGLLDLNSSISILFSLIAGKQYLGGSLRKPSVMALFWWAIQPSLKNISR